jgi:lipoprotein signal peptidase
VRTGIFNVADMAVMLGALIVLWAGYRFDRHTDSY